MTSVIRLKSAFASAFTSMSTAFAQSGGADSNEESDPIQTIALEQSGGVPTNRIANVTSESTVNYTYDAAGNVTNDGAHTYTYDSENRIVSVDGGSTASSAYDHQNRRYKKTVGATVTHYVWQASQVIAEHNGSTGAVLVDYVHSGGRMLAKVASGSTQYFLADRLSTRMTLDSSGNVSGRQAHLPFGEDFGESGTQEKHHFNSYDRDSESETDYAWNRQYLHSVGRFNRVDPLAAGSKDAFPQSWNRYAYAINDPINMKDPSGLDFFTASGGRGPCNPFGPVFLLGGFEFSRDMSCFFVVAAPIVFFDPEPAPAAATTCKINLLTSGPRIGRYRFAGDILRTPDIRSDWDHGEHVDSNGLWTFLFEVEVLFSGGPFRRSEWAFGQSAISNWALRIALPNGNEYINSDTRVTPDDMAHPVNRYIEANRFLWMDSPALPYLNADGIVVEGKHTWFLAFFATNKKTGVRCFNRLTLELTLTRAEGPGQPRGVPSWRVF